MSDAYAVRIARLERQVQFWRFALVSLATLCLLGFVWRSSANASSATLAHNLEQKAEEKTALRVLRLDATAVVAKEFDLIDDSNRIVGRLARDPDQADSYSFVLKYPNNEVALSALVSETSASFKTYSVKGKSSIGMDTDLSGSGIAVFDNDGHVRIIGEIRKKGPQVMILNPDMTKYVWRVPVRAPRQ